MPESRNIGLQVLLDNYAVEKLNLSGQHIISKSGQEKIEQLNLSHYLGKYSTTQTVELDSVVIGRAIEDLGEKLIDMGQTLKRPFLGLSTKIQKAKALKYLLIFSIYIPNAFGMRQSDLSSPEVADAFKTGADIISKLFKLLESIKDKKGSKADRSFFRTSVEVVSSKIREFYTKYLSRPEVQLYVLPAEKSLCILKSKTV